MNTTLAVSSQPLPIIPMGEMERMALAVSKSGLFGVNTPDQALALMLVAQAEGRHPASAAKEYHIIKGRPALKADAMLARFQQAGGSVAWEERTNSKVSAKFSHPQGGELVVTWTLEDAKTAGLASGDNWRKYPRQMLSARVVSEGVRAVFPSVVSGLYTPEEVQDFDVKSPATVEKPVIKTEPIVAEIVEEEPVKELPQTCYDMLFSMMDTDGISEDHILHFLYAKKAIKSRDIYIFDISEKMVNRMIEVWDEIKAFKPAI
jgi:hypothetical protein